MCKKEEMMRSHSKVCAVIGGFALFLFVVGLSIRSSTHMPENAQIYLNDTTRTYSAPPCISDPAGLRLGTAGDAHRLQYKPDTGSKEAGAFFREGRSLSGMLLEKIGILGPVPARWNADGSWNY